MLSLTVDQIDFDQARITYKQMKSPGFVKEVIITYPQHVMTSLRTYIGNRTGLVFVTTNGKPVRPTQIDRNFKQAGDLAGIPFRVSPHVLQTSTVTILKRHGEEDSSIIKVTGHSSTVIIARYDRRVRDDNATRRVNLL